jgi:hypothetical protein
MQSELRLLDAHILAIAEAAGGNARIFELGDGGVAVRQLRRALVQVAPRDPVRTVVVCRHAPFDDITPLRAVRALIALGRVAGEEAELIVASRYSVVAMRAMLAAAGWLVDSVHTCDDLRLWRCVRR